MVLHDVRADLCDLAEAAVQAVISGSDDDVAAAFHPDAHNREADAEPPGARGRGPAAFVASGQWLRAAYDSLEWTTERHVVDGDLVVTYGTLSGRHTGDFVVWTPDLRVERVFTPTGRTFAVQHAHFQRFADRLVVEHWAVRDDQGQAVQLGWVPPSPAYLLRCSRATRRARRAALKAARPA